MVLVGRGGGDALAIKIRVGDAGPRGDGADLAVLDRDYLTCPEDEIRRIKVTMTMVDGRIVYQRK